MNDAQWWQHRYNRLVAECFYTKPFDPAEHEDHDVYEARTFADDFAIAFCAECPPVLIPKEKRDQSV
jgi:hypothetical protein